MQKFFAALAVGCFAVLPAAAQTVKERLPACLDCHGENGQSQNPDVPSLGAQHAFYVTVQLLLFRERMRVRIERARALVQQNHCNFCHTPNFAGQQNVPRIADQREDYLIKALRGYKDNSRRGYDATMAETMAPISDDQILDLAYYIARVK